MGFILPVWISAAALLLLLLATLHPRFLAWWEQVVMVTFCGLAWLLLHSVAGQPPPPGSGESGAFHANTLLLNELQVIIAGCALTRLRFFWFTAASLTIFGLTIIVAFRTTGPAFGLFLGGTGIFVAPALAALMLVAYLQERSARSEFSANQRLDQARAHEQRRREQTEGMLHVLSQAIGGIVHDLGGPLTSVRTGTETLRLLGGEDKELQEELLDIVTDGALMLDYLRLSLLEQTRVLEGKPIPLQCAAASFRGIIEASMKYQKSRMTSGRKVTAAGEETEIFADGMKMTTVFMNLLGNALKYSDGDVHIRWRQEQGRLLCAVLDRGRSSQGVSQADARRLFVAFGRLDVHAGLEGTGLGLLSVQKIMEAHGGEVFIEGYVSGHPSSARFTTAHGTYAPLLGDLLEESFRTAFVVACPLQAPANLQAPAKSLSLLEPLSGKGLAD